MPETPVTYTCDHCGGVFDSGRTEAEANAEARANWGVDRTQDPTMAVICDDCYRAMLAWMADAGSSGADRPH